VLPVNDIILSLEEDDLANRAFFEKLLLFLLLIVALLPTLILRNLRVIAILMFYSVLVI
jgi:hypothetical protein